MQKIELSNVPSQLHIVCILYRPLLYDFSEKLAPAVPIGAAGESFFKIAYFLNIFDKYHRSDPPFAHVWPYDRRHLRA